jgi:hypothetical protein
MGCPQPSCGSVVVKEVAGIVESTDWRPHREPAVRPMSWVRGFIRAFLSEEFESPRRLPPFCAGSCNLKRSHRAGRRRFGQDGRMRMPLYPPGRWRTSADAGGQGVKHRRQTLGSCAPIWQRSLIRGRNLWFLCPRARVPLRSRTSPQPWRMHRCRPGRLARPHVPVSAPQKLSLLSRGGDAAGVSEITTVQFVPSNHRLSTGAWQGVSSEPGILSHIAPRHGLTLLLEAGL